MKAECPSEIMSTEGNNVKYFKDFEGDNSQVSNKEINLYDFYKNANKCWISALK